MTSLTLRIDLAYHGAEFSGWAAQPGRRTVERELGSALETVLDEPAELTVAGRTDAGVHAWGQVASLPVGAAPDRDLVRALNGITADDLVVNRIEPLDGFDARRDALSRTYCYRILASPRPSPFERGLALWWPHPLELGALEACAAALRGTHDFTAFTPTDSYHVRFEREISRAEWVLREGLLEFWIEADAFLRGMVRALVGTMLQVSTGRRSLDDFVRLLAGAPRPEAGDSAPPHGLYLARVAYRA